jgi:hypothetical protein
VDAKICLIDLATPSPEQPIAILYSPEAYVGLMEEAGYNGILVNGLEELGAKAFTGKLTNEFTFPVDPDAYFMLKFYLQVENAAQNPTGHISRVYLADGIFEFSVVFHEQWAVTRVGIFRDNAEPPWSGATTISRKRYVAIWRTIATRILAASQSGCS